MLNYYLNIESEQLTENLTKFVTLTVCELLLII